jgi:imidazole glycerol-phosphate synthase subunit HisH
VVSDLVIPQLTQPVLGICLGMQLLADRSRGRRCALPRYSCRHCGKNAGQSRDAPVPNMGWCRVTQRKPHPLLKGIVDGSHFYFIHSYALPVSDYSIARPRMPDP